MSRKSTKSGGKGNAISESDRKPIEKADDGIKQAILRMIADYNLDAFERVERGPEAVSEPAYTAAVDYCAHAKDPESLAAFAQPKRGVAFEVVVANIRDQYPGTPWKDIARIIEDLHTEGKIRIDGDKLAGEYVNVFRLPGARGKELVPAQRELPDTEECSSFGVDLTLTEVSERYDIPKSAISKAALLPPDHPGFLPSRKWGCNRFIPRHHAVAFAKNYEARREARSLQRIDGDS